VLYGRLVVNTAERSLLPLAYTEAGYTGGSCQGDCTARVLMTALRRRIRAAARQRRPHHPRTSPRSRPPLVGREEGHRRGFDSIDLVREAEQDGFKRNLTVIQLLPNTRLRIGELGLMTVRSRKGTIYRVVSLNNDVRKAIPGYRDGRPKIADDHLFIGQRGDPLQPLGVVLLGHQQFTIAQSPPRASVNYGWLVGW
jgi:integrase